MFINPKSRWFYNDSFMMNDSSFRKESGFIYQNVEVQNPGGTYQRLSSKFFPAKWRKTIEIYFNKILFFQNPGGSNKIYRSFLSIKWVLSLFWWENVFKMAGWTLANGSFWIKWIIMTS